MERYARMRVTVASASYRRGTRGTRIAGNLSVSIGGNLGQDAISASYPRIAAATTMSYQTVALTGVSICENVPGKQQRADLFRRIFKHVSADV